MVTSAQPLLRRHTAPPLQAHKDDACWFWGHPGDSGQPHLEIRNCLPLGKDPFFKYDRIPRFQSSGQEPISGGPLSATVTGQQP